ncbi:sensor histidine kinase [Streptomyces sp. WAC06614]|uniref:sensor histidine kinase n=1 Tax=Streptomyces sp. WAC06614 TaxID=2487416 RepID=UPI000F7837BF|nr:histidine kinase [Streptomyces sp. WAC06614]RSS58191.1 sensor histidine kinase [Streptomyces sp. WAC06614]
MQIRRGSASDDGAAKERRPVFGWTRNDALVAVGAAVTDLIGYGLAAADGGRPVTVPALALVVLTAPCLLARRARPLTVLAAVLALGAAFDLATGQAPHFSAASMVALYTVTRRRNAAVTAAAAAATVPLTLVGRGTGGSSLLAGLLGNTVAVLLVVLTGLVVRRWQQEAEARRILLADRAVAEERRRIARELHDIVAHHITTMQLMAGGARANLAHDPDVARDALVTLEDSGRLALREMRQLLDVLRAGEEPEQAPPAPQPGTDDLGRIITESRLAGTPTEFTVRGHARPLPPTVGLTVFRIVQEALTNARKHAWGAPAHVRLTYAPDGVEVEVRDEGAPGARPPRTARPGAGSGYGLIGMRERVALQGGTLEAGPCDGGGFRVAAVLPAGGPGGQREDRRG